MAYEPLGQRPVSTARLPDVRGNQDPSGANYSQRGGTVSIVQIFARSRRGHDRTSPLILESVNWCNIAVSLKTGQNALSPDSNKLALCSVVSEFICDPGGWAARRKRASSRTGEPDLNLENPPYEPPSQPNVHAPTAQHNSLSGCEVDVPGIYPPPVRTRQAFPEEAGSKVFM
jgi:hypothetical protein